MTTETTSDPSGTAPSASGGRQPEPARPVPAPPGYVLVANDGAGSTDRDAVHTIAGILAAHRPTELRWTSDPGQLDDALAALEGRRLVVAGGDGSIHLALNRLAGEDAAVGDGIGPVGIVPAGTGNDYARNLGLPLDVAAATEAVVSGVPRPMPAVQLPDGQLAANNLHFGLGLVASLRAQDWKPRLHRFAYPLATLVEGVTFDGVPVAVSVDGEERFRGRALAGVVLLAGPSVGGGRELVSEHHEHRLDVVVVEAGSTGRRLADAVAAARSRLEDREGTHHWTGATVTVDVTRPDGGRRADLDGVADGSEVPAGRADDVVLELDVDGEISRHPVPATFTIRPDVWTVLVPAGT